MNTPHAPPSGWEAKFGSRRREIDKKILQTLERQIAREERPIPQIDHDDARRRIALAFGRPI